MRVRCVQYFDPHHSSHATNVGVVPTNSKVFVTPVGAELFAAGHSTVGGKLLAARWLTCAGNQVHHLAVLSLDDAGIFLQYTMTLRLRHQSATR